MTGAESLAYADQVLAFVRREMGHLTAFEQTSVLGVAFGLSAGDALFPANPAQSLVNFGPVLGTAAGVAQGRRAVREKLSCVGMA